ncbi:MULTISPECIES: zinc-binding dehydrogenase [Rhizobium]|uniref:quinone oxidoreductase family protein n=1 Tax=Rhizobium TaxID=379 RepID=UPI00195CE4F6|nr:MULTISPECIES: zinc-binding dehydrogenase [Rhizobium]MBM7045951.1 zinc-binding dehydrogenase [Rhizobium lusitanum]
MRAVQYKRFGGPEVLEVVEVETPRPAPGEVLVKVHVAGVNFFEALMRAGRYAVTPPLPVFPGVEVAGVVEALGEGSDLHMLGARVAVPLFATGRGAGGYAEYIAVNVESLIPLPDALAFEDAAALMVQGLTALHLIRQAPPAGRVVLIHAAAGGVGSLLLQLARRAGASRIIATASNAEKRALACSLGADAAIDYTVDGWQNEIGSQAAGADLIYEMIGGSVSRASIEALAPGGEMVFGAMGRFELDTADIERMLGLNQSLKGFALLPLLTPENLRRDLLELFDLAAKGELTVVQGGRFSLEAAAEAHRALESRKASGKIVLVP